LIAGLFAAVFLSVAVNTNASNDLGYLQADSALTIDASTPEFQFTTFETLSGGMVNFINLEAADTLILHASEAIRIDGLLMFAPVVAIRFEAPQIEPGADAVLEMPLGGLATLVAGGADGGNDNR
jgi:hypothetical protein